MTAGYQPSSAFLIQVLNEEVPLSGSEYATANLNKVIGFVTDQDATNRDWAAFILSNFDLDTPELRSALVAFADDPNDRVRAEAIRGLAQRDRALALPYIQSALSNPPVMVNIFEAAAIVADPALLAPLKAFAGS
ncbi:HEAT repeat domain-containing protein [Sphingobium sp. Leaf26]|uniref:HEAT repeat domain-containing protein n=1 Tax=Sphingobium sp. Leaf26 TaxID=1735693 RepID=UPI0009E90751|nr:HEAT repeat domain-containing protein [Sphingobium sp. Leaf26]